MGPTRSDSAGHGERTTLRTAVGGRADRDAALIRESVRRAKVPKAKPRTWRGAALAKELPVA
ncbi:hypothetical protein ACWD01_35375, partial [Streptomyces sp. NPDC002835]